MQIEITKEQYKNLIKMNSLANAVLGILSDFSKDEKYEKILEETEKVENYFLNYAKDFDCKKLVETDDDEVCLKEEFFENEVMSILFDYDKCSLIESLSSDLAWRDFRKKYSQKQIDEMAKKNGGYFGVALYEYEKKYWDEFEKNNFDRLEIKEN